MGKKYPPTLIVASEVGRLTNNGHKARKGLGLPDICISSPTLIVRIVHPNIYVTAMLNIAIWANPLSSPPAYILGHSDSTGVTGVVNYSTGRSDSYAMSHSGYYDMGQYAIFITNLQAGP